MPLNTKNPQINHKSQKINNKNLTKIGKHSILFIISTFGLYVSAAEPYQFFSIIEG